MPETVSLSLQYANVILLQGEGQHVEDSDQIPGENGMIYITGDTHGDFARFSAKRLRRTGMEPYDFILDQNDDETNSIVFYSAVSFPFLWELPMGMLYSRRMIRIRRRCVSGQIRICTGIRRR